MHPAAARSFLSALGALLSEDVATAKLGHRLNLNGSALNGATPLGWQEVLVSMALFSLRNQCFSNIVASDFSARPLSAACRSTHNHHPLCLATRFIILLPHVTAEEIRVCLAVLLRCDTTLVDMWDKQRL